MDKFLPLPSLLMQWNADRKNVFAAGFQRHLIKPIAPEALVEAIADLLY